MPRVAVYIRVSTDEQAEHGVSLDVQRDDCIELAHELGDDDPVVYCDDASGLTLNRPEIRKLLSCLADYTHLVVWTTDRLSRNLTDKLAMTDELVRLGIDLIAVREPIDIVSAAGRMQYNLMGAVGQYESERKRESVAAAMTREARRGRYVAGDVYGYEPGPDGIIRPHPVEAPVVREVFERLAAGESLAAIARAMTSRGLPRKRSGHVGPWQTTHLARMTRNPIYRGQVRWHGHVYDGLHPAIISDELWDRVQHRLELRATTNHGHWIYSLAPILRCGLCGSRVACSKCRPNAIASPRAYKCIDRALRPQHLRHTAIASPERKVAAAIWRHTELLLESGEMAEILVAHDEHAVEALRSRSDIEGRLRDIDVETTLNLRAARSGLITWDVLDGENGALMAERREIEMALAGQAHTSRSAPVAGGTSVASSDQYSIRDALYLLRDEGSIEEQVQFLRCLYDRIELYPPTPCTPEQAAAEPSRSRRTPGAPLDGGSLHLWHHGMAQPVIRLLPRYYSSHRGITDLGW